MKSTEIRDSNWRAMLNKMPERCLVVWQRMISNGGSMTVREWAERWEVEHTSVAPRITELQQIGLVVLAGRKGGRGLYRAVSEEAARAKFYEERNPQLYLKLHA